MRVTQSQTKVVKIIPRPPASIPTADQEQEFRIGVIDNEKQVLEMEDGVVPNMWDAMSRSQFDGRSLWCMRVHNPIRAVAIRIIEWPPFDGTILLAIIANSCILGLVDFGTVDSENNPITTGSWQNTFVQGVDPFFTWLFLIECVVKIVGHGFMKYLKSPWNVLDFVVVVSR